jgi:hypothetical protein
MAWATAFGDDIYGLYLLLWAVLAIIQHTFGGEWVMFSTDIVIYKGDMNGLQHGAYLAKSCACNMFIQLPGRCAADGFVSFLLTSFIKTIGWEGGMSYDGMKFVLHYTCVGWTLGDCTFPSRTCRCLMKFVACISHQSRSRQDRRRCFHLHPLIFSRRST